jgi:hypothetical protein
MYVVGLLFADKLIAYFSHYSKSRIYILGETKYSLDSVRYCVTMMCMVRVESKQKGERALGKGDCCKQMKKSYVPCSMKHGYFNP